MNATVQPAPSSTASLIERDLAMFGKIGVSIELLEAAHVERVSDRDARERFGIQGPSSRDMAGIVFPYHSHVNGRRVTCRVRRDHPEIEKGKPKDKYISAYGDRKSLYFPPGAWDKLQGIDTPIVLIESEKAALALTAWAQRTGKDALPVALGGCWGWRGRIGKADGIDGHRVDVTGPISDLDVCDGRTVYVMLDANVSTNSKVQAARSALAQELRKRGCTVKVCDLPQTEGVNGPDDFIAAHGDDAMSKVFADAAASEDAPEGFSDDALALRFTAKHGDDLRFTSLWGRWSRWDGHRWEPDETLTVYDLARSICREAADTADNKNVAQRVNSAATIAAVERLARSDRHHAAAVSQWDCDPWLLNTPGGAIDLRSGELHPSDRLDYCTKSTSVAPGGECPLWLRFLHTVTGGVMELQEYLQRVCGYVLTGSTREHALFFLYGLGANGKSVFVSTIAGILGDYSKVAAVESFTASQGESHPTDLAGLQGARLVTAIETEDGRRWAESKLKSLTGGDKIAARYMRQDFFEYAPQFKLLIAGNHRPGLRTVDEAMRRRFHLIPFNVTIPLEERDKELPEKLRAEWPGILQWMIAGCLAWQREGLHPPAIVVNATNSYMADEDALGLWIDDRCNRDRASWTSTRALFESWTEWAEKAGEYVGNQKRFSQNLEAKGFARDPRRDAKGFRGIGLRGDL